MGMSLYRGFISIFLLLGMSIETNGQDSLSRFTHTAVLLDQQVNNADIEDLFKISGSDTTTLLNNVENQLVVLRGRGYLNANLDQYSLINDTMFSDIYIGRKYRFQYQLDSLDEILLGENNIKSIKKYQEDKRGFEQEFLTVMANNGYPFAHIDYEKAWVKNDTVFLKTEIEANELILFDTLNIGIDANINRKFVENYLDIKYGQVYDSRKIKLIRKRINELPYLKLNKEPSVQFVNGLASIYLPLKDVKANRFDFIIGLLPNTSNGARRWVITGDLTGEFQNLLSGGDYIFVNFKRLKPETQNINLKFSMPYLFNLPVGPDIDFFLFKNENISLDVNSQLGIHYQMAGANHLSLHWHLTRSRLIDIDTLSLLNSGVLPANLDFDYHGGKLSFNYEKLDYKYNPSSGWNFGLNLSLGNRKIVRNATIESFDQEDYDFSSQYDSLGVNNFQGVANLDFSYYIRTADIGAVKLNFNGLYKYSNTSLLTNELVRFGGNRDLRGFDEQSFLVDRYAMFTLEYRFILDKNSYLTLPFVQYARVRRRIEDNFSNDNPIGVGLGISFTTPAGLFNVSFAAGKQLDQGFDFNNTKIHFGYVSRF